MAEDGGGSEQDDVSFLRTVSEPLAKGSAELQRYLIRHRFIAGRHGVPFVHGDRRTRVPGGRRIRQSTLLFGEHCGQECAARSVPVHVRHRASVVGASAARAGHGRGIRIGEYEI